MDVVGRTARVYGVIECVYAHSGAFTVLAMSSALPAPRNGLKYIQTAAGDIAIGEGDIKVHGGTVGASARFEDSYAI